VNDGCRPRFDLCKISEDGHMWLCHMCEEKHAAVVKIRYNMVWICLGCLKKGITMLEDHYKENQDGIPEGS